MRTKEQYILAIPHPGSCRWRLESVYQLVEDQAHASGIIESSHSYHRLPGFQVRLLLSLSTVLLVAVFGQLCVDL